MTSDPQEIAGLTYVPLFNYEAMLAVANQHPLANKPFIVPEDLSSEILITYPVERTRGNLRPMPNHSRSRVCTGPAKSSKPTKTNAST